MVFGFLLANVPCGYSSLGYTYMLKLTISVEIRARPKVLVDGMFVGTGLPFIIVERGM
jgi:hypothetical protein